MGSGSDTAKGRLGVESVCAAPLPETCWLKALRPTAGLLSVAASDFHFSLAPEICTVALGLAGHGAQTPSTPCSTLVLACLYQIDFKDLMGRGSGRKEANGFVWKLFAWQYPMFPAWGRKE